jgi:hypothetical protein
MRGAGRKRTGTTSASLNTPPPPPGAMKVMLLHTGAVLRARGMLQPAVPLSALFWGIMEEVLEEEKEKED